MSDDNPNLRIWKQLEQTPGAHTKDYTGSGGFRGTEYKPAFMYHRLTALFGPVGLGWGWQVLEDCGETDGAGFKVGDQVQHERVHTVLAQVWVRIDGERVELPPQYGCTASVVYRGKKGEMETIVDAKKMSVTDAVSKSFQALGMIADILQGWHGKQKPAGTQAQRPPAQTKAPPPATTPPGEGRSSRTEPPADQSPQGERPPLGKPLAALVENLLAKGDKKGAMKALQGAWNRAEDEQSQLVTDKQIGLLHARAAAVGMSHDELHGLVMSLFGRGVSGMLSPIVDGLLAVLESKKAGPAAD